MPRAGAVLVDVYDTVLSCDFRAHAVELPRLAGVPEDEWERRSKGLSAAVMDGSLTLKQAFAQIIESSGQDPTERLLDDLVRRDQELLLRGTVLYEDTIPFLTGLRALGIRSAFVSNCAENTRTLLDHYGLTGLVDAVVLSCEKGCVKPSPELYERALADLDVPAEAAVFVDDQQSYCEGAERVGVQAFRICRTGSSGDGTVRTLSELLDRLP